MAQAAMLMVGGARRGHRRLRPELRRHARPSPRCSPPRSRTCSSTAPAASPSAWPPTWPRTTSSRSSAPPGTSSPTPRAARRPDAVRPRPDLPTGGKIVGLDGIRDAYDTGRGAFRTRATCRIENVTPRRKGIVVTELPYLLGPEKVIEKIKDLVQSKRLQGIADVKDLTDRDHGLRLVIEVKNGFNPEAVLEQLYRLTPMEESFGINNVALVDGQPRTLGLKELLKVYVDHRTRRRPAPHRIPAAPGARTGCTWSRACSSRSSTSTRSSS